MSSRLCRQPEDLRTVLRVRSSPKERREGRLWRYQAQRGPRLHLAADTPGHPLALHMMPASTEDRAEAGRLAQAVRASTGQGVGLACVEGGRTGLRAADAAGAHGLELEVARLPGARRRFVLPPRRRVVERPFAWATRFRRLVGACEGYASTLTDLHLAALTCLMLKQAARPTSGL